MTKNILTSLAALGAALSISACSAEDSSDPGARRGPLGKSDAFGSCEELLRRTVRERHLLVR